jgi:hypothetical protein
METLPNADAVTENIALTVAPIATLRRGRVLDERALEHLMRLTDETLPPAHPRRGLAKLRVLNLEPG